MNTWQATLLGSGWLACGIASPLQAQEQGQGQRQEQEQEQELDRTTREDLERQLEELRKNDAVQQETIERLLELIEQLRQEPPPGQADPDDLENALDRAILEAESAQAERLEAPATLYPGVSMPAQWFNLRLVDLSLDVLVAAGGSTERDSSIENLQAGGHDPRKRGFTFQQAELSVIGAVDPFVTAEGHFIASLDPDTGETIWELEEAFATTTSLPSGLQLEVGHFFTEFGRHNPLHPHQWRWQDSPVIMTRVFGGDGTRAPGARLGWLAPLPWYSEIHVGIQNSDSEQMASFRGELGHHGEEENGDEFEGLSGLPTVERRTSGLDDFTYLARWVNGFELGDDISGQAGVSGLFGPNNTGEDGRTAIFGADLLVKWRSPRAHKGWPFVEWLTEFVARDYETDDFFSVEDPTDPTDDLAIAGETLEDWGLYTQVLWGFKPDYAIGLRYEFAAGAGEGLERRSMDPLRDDRTRLSPLLLWQLSEYTRIRLQYNYDRAQHLRHDAAHSGWLGFEFSFGAHPAHSY